MNNKINLTRLLVIIFLFVFLMSGSPFISKANAAGCPSFASLEHQILKGYDKIAVGCGRPNLSLSNPKNNMVFSTNPGFNQIPVAGTTSSDTLPYSIKYQMDAGATQTLKTFTSSNTNVFNESILIDSTLAEGNHSLKIWAQNVMGPDAVTYTFSFVLDKTVPSTPQNLSTPYISGSSVVLSWTASSDNVGGVSYDIYNGSINVGTTNNTSFTVNNLSYSTTYSFTVRAKDAVGYVSSPSSSVTITTLADNEAPTSPSNLLVANSTGSSVTLSWTASSDNVAVSGYDIYNDTSVIGSVYGATTTYTVTGINENVTYLFSVKAKDAVGNLSAASNMINFTIDTLAPTIPSNLRATKTTSNSVSLLWDQSTDNVGVNAYDIFNGLTLVGSTETNSYTVTGLTYGTPYSFYVKARDAANNVSVASTPVSITTSSDIQAPTAPSNVKLINITSSSATITWTASTDNVGVARYDIYIGTNILGSVNGNTTTFVISNLSPNNIYSLSVKAIDDVDNVSNSSKKVFAIPTGTHLKYNYEAGRLKTITLNATGQVFKTYIYDNNGNLKTVIVGQ